MTTASNHPKMECMQLQGGEDVVASLQSKYITPQSVQGRK